MITATRWGSHRTTSPLWARDTLSKHETKILSVCSRHCPRWTCHCCCWYLSSALCPSWQARLPDDRQEEIVSVFLAVKISVRSQSLPWNHPRRPWSDLGPDYPRIHFQNRSIRCLLKIRLSPGDGELISKFWMWYDGDGEERISFWKRSLSLLGWWSWSIDWWI